jgi:4-aminobutyrate--pyruvate transaminase
MVDAMAFCPPLIIEQDEIDMIVDGIADALAALKGQEF